MSLSFIICSYNRAPFVRRLLLTLLSQVEIAPDTEIIVVDNNSRDDTREVVTRFAIGRPFIRYAFEGRQGLSNARNCGAAAARGGHLLFLDDDALVVEGFVDEMRRVVRAANPDFFGGPIHPIYADRLPESFPEHLEIRKKAPKTGFHRDVTMSGGNFGVRKATLERLGGVDPRYGMTGDKVGMLEERLLVDAYKEATPVDAQRLYYTLEGGIFHHTPALRMTHAFQRKRIYVADYQMSRHLLSQGLRSPGMFFRAARQRLFFILSEQIQTLISPKANSMVRFHCGIQVWRAWAAVRACVDHYCSRKNTAPRVAENSAAELRVLWLVMPERGSAARNMSRESKSHELIEEVFANGPVSVERIVFDRAPNNKTLNERLVAASPHAFDAVLFEDELPEGTAKISRAHYPHLQYLVRLGRSKLMNVIDNMDTRDGRLRAIKRNWPAITKAIAKDRATVRYADVVITSSHWERRFYLRLFGPRRRFAYVPPAPPKSLVKAAIRARTEATRNGRLVVVGDVAPSQFESRQAFRAARYFDAAKKVDNALAATALLHVGKKPEERILRHAPGLACVGVVSRDEYSAVLAAADAALMGDEFRAGHPSRIVEAALCGTPYILPHAAWKRLDPHLSPLAEPYRPGDARSLAAAIARARANRDRNWDRVLKMRKAALAAWGDIIGECRRWMRPHAPTQRARKIDEAA